MRSHGPYESKCSALGRKCGAERRFHWVTSSVNPLRFRPMYKTSIISPLILALVLPGGCERTTASLGYKILQTYDHDPEAYTQGLLFHDGYLFESTGRYGESTLRKVELETGRVVARVAIDSDYFAE